MTASEVYAELIRRHIFDFPSPTDARLLADLPPHVERHRPVLARVYRDAWATIREQMSRKEYRAWEPLVAATRARWPWLWQEHAEKAAWLLLIEGAP